MSQQMNQGTNTASPTETPMKRKRGRPRKDESQSSPRLAAPSIPQWEGSGASKSTANIQSKGKGIVEDVNDDDDDQINDEMIGQAVTGVLEYPFEAGYFLTIKVGDSNKYMRGVVFKEGCVVPVTPENDIAPNAKMYKRRDLPIPVMKSTPQVPSSLNPTENTENRQQQKLPSENATQKDDQPSFRNARTNDKDQEQGKLSDDKEMQEHLSGDKQLQEKLSGDMEFQEKLSGDKELQEKLSGNKELQEKLSSNEEFQEKLTDDKELQEKLSGDKEIQEMLTDDKELQEKLSGDKELQEKLSGDKELQERLSGDKELQGKLSGDKELQERLSGDKELRGKLSGDKELQERLSGDKEFQGKLSGDKELQEKLSGDKELQEKLTDDKELQEKLSDDKELQEKLSGDKELQEKLSDDMELQENLSGKTEGVKDSSEPLMKQQKTDQMAGSLSLVFDLNAEEVNPDETANNTVVLKEAVNIPPEIVIPVKESSVIVPTVVEHEDCGNSGFQISMENADNEDESSEPQGELVSPKATE